MEGLRNVLDRLSCKVRSTSEDIIADLTIQLAKAELSLVYLLCHTCALRLVGKASPFLEVSASFLSIGDVQDLCDTLELHAQELETLRAEAEAEMTRSSEADMTTEALQSMANALVAREIADFEEVRKLQSAFAEAIRNNLSKVSRQINDALFKSLKLARDARSKEELLRCGQSGQRDIEAACGVWLAEFSVSHLLLPPAAAKSGLGAALAAAMAKDRALHNFVIAARKAMFLRRRQVRVDALQKRAAACRSCVGIIAKIEASIML